jgi:hypothetical protein
MDMKEAQFQQLLGQTVIGNVPRGKLKGAEGGLKSCALRNAPALALLLFRLPS